MRQPFSEQFLTVSRTGRAPSSAEGPFPHVLASAVGLLMMLILTLCGDRSLTAVLIYISLISVGEQLSVCWPSVCPLGRNVYAGAPPVFQSDCLGVFGIKLYEFLINFVY